METKQTSDEIVLGKVGIVTGRIGPDTLGQISLSFNGGTELYSARAFHPEETIPVGTEIVVSKFFPPRTVLVSLTNKN